MSTSSGPNYGTAVDGGGGAFSWTNPSNASTNNGVYATTSLSGGTQGNYLDWTGFGFGLSSTDTVDGIILEVAYFSSGTGAVDNEVKLLKAGSRVGSNKAAAQQFLSLSIETYGSATDLWGTTWLYSDVNASNFGAAWAGISGPPRTMSVDYARITIWYTPASGVTTSVSALIGGGTLVSPAISGDANVSVSSLVGSGTLVSPAISGVADAVSVSPLVGSGTLVSPLVSGDANVSASPLVGSGTLPSPTITGGVSVTASLSPLVGSGTLPAVVVAADANASVSPLAGSATLVTPAVGAIQNATVSVGPLVGSGTLPPVSVSVAGNVSVNVGPLVGNGTLPPLTHVWPNPSGGLTYQIYSNDGLGGPIDYDSPIDETQALSWTSPTLAYPGDWLFGVRVYSLTSGLEEQNVDAFTRLILDATGTDITHKPFAPVGLRAHATKGGTASVEWSYPFTSRTKRPTGFYLYKGVLTVDYSTIVATVGFSGSGSNYQVKLSGLSDGVTYLVGVRAFNATAEESNTATASFTADSVGPMAVDSLASSAI